jgi:hypothetical protein
MGKRRYLSYGKRKLRLVSGFWDIHISGKALKRSLYS